MSWVLILRTVQGGEGIPSDEPFVLFGYLAALTQLELVPAVIILAQRQTVLVAKQAVEVNILTGGKLRLGVGVGWNPVEFEALGINFNTRGRMIEEQVEVLRLLWSQDVVSYQGRFHTITEAGLNPLPTGHSIPIWMGGDADVLLRRVAHLGDGWFPQGQPDAKMRETVERLRGYVREAGRDPGTIGLEARMNAREVISTIGCARQKDGENWEQHISPLTQWVQASNHSMITLMLFVDTEKP